MKKLKIYLDTSVISHLKQEDAPEKMKDTLKLWEMLKQDIYETYLSSVTLDEINGCQPEKLNYLLDRLSEIKYKFIPVNDTILNIAEKFISMGFLTKKSLSDCTHIAAAISAETDIIVSWNFKHIVNHKTVQGVKVITALEGYDPVLIYTPTYLIEGDEQDE